jgi:hypothetical protein
MIHLYAQKQAATAIAIIFGIPTRPELISLPSLLYWLPETGQVAKGGTNLTHVHTFSFGSAITSSGNTGRYDLLWLFLGSGFE